MGRLALLGEAVVVHGADGLVDAEAVEQPALLLGVVGVVHLADQAVDAEAADKVLVHLGASGEELGADVEVRVGAARGIEQVLADVDWRRVAVVDADAVEDLGEARDVVLHVLPEERRVAWTFTEAQLDAVAPGDQFAAQVDARGRAAKVDQRIGGPDPAVVRDRQAPRVFALGARVLRVQASEVRLKEGGSVVGEVCE